MTHLSAGELAEDAMLRQREAASQLGYSVTYFKSLGIPYIGKGRAKRYRWGTIKAWIQKEQDECLASMSSKESATGSSTAYTRRKSVSARPAGVRPISEALASLTAGKRKLLPAG